MHIISVVTGKMLELFHPFGKQIWRFSIRRTAVLIFSMTDWKIYSRNSGMTGHKIGSDAVIKNSMITDGCRIDGEVEHSVLFAGVKVAPGAVVKDAVVMGGTVIKPGAVVEHCIIGENAVIGENAKIGVEKEGEDKGVATIGPGVYVGDGATVGSNAMVRENVKDGEEEW